MAAARNLEIEARANEAARHSTTISPANCRLFREYARRRGSNKNGANERDQMKRDETLSSNPIARKLVASLRRSLRGKVVNIGHVIKARAAAEDLQRTVVTADRLAGYHPAHAAYVYTQNQVSVLAEQITALKELAPFAAIISKAEDLYMPSSPPMSPLTTSYYTCWAFFDACVGAAKETIGTIILEFGTEFGIDAGQLRLIRLMQESRMGFYIYQGRKGDLVVLEELVTGAVRHAIVPVGCRSLKGELWYVRVLPPPIPGYSEHVVFTTPYVVLQPGLHEWMAYFSRTIKQTARFDDYELHMKYGPTRKYWNDFVFAAYVNHRTDVIYLKGLPDLPESRPHSEVHGWGFGR